MMEIVADLDADLILGAPKRKLSLRDGSRGQREVAVKTKLLLVSLVLAWASGSLLAQNAGQSLGDLARKEREKRLKIKMERSVRVWNNDNMPRRPAGEGPTAAAGMSLVPVSPGPTESSLTDAPASSNSPDHDEKYYRERMAELREALELHKRQLSVLEQKQAQGQTQYFSDPNKTLQEEFSRSEINKRNDEISKKQEEITTDEKAIEDLQDQLRREGKPAGWLR